jgi:hypothetical protein
MGGGDLKVVKKPRKNRHRKGTCLNTAKSPLNRQVGRHAPMVMKEDEIEGKMLE